MQYRVITRSYLDVFQEAMDDAIAQGWTPQGGMSVCAEERKVRPPGDVVIIKTFYQAMVKDDVGTGGRG